MTQCSFSWLLKLLPYLGYTSVFEFIKYCWWLLQQQTFKAFTKGGSKRTYSKNLVNIYRYLVLFTINDVRNALHKSDSKIIYSNCNFWYYKICIYNHVMLVLLKKNIVPYMNPSIVCPPLFAQCTWVKKYKFFGIAVEICFDFEENSCDVIRVCRLEYPHLTSWLSFGHFWRHFW